MSGQFSVLVFSSSNSPRRSRMQNIPKQEGKKLSNKIPISDVSIQHGLENLDKDRCKLEILPLAETSAFITPFSLHLTNHR